MSVSGPFDVAHPVDVPLPSAPLIRVLAQLRFPQLVTMRPQTLASTVETVLERLASDYPILEQRQEMALSIGVEGFSQQQASSVWEMQSGDGEWAVTIGSAWVSIHTSKYTNLPDFLERLSALSPVISETIKPPFVDRLGLRYTNRVENADFMANLQRMVRPEMQGGAGAVLESGVTKVRHTLSEVMLEDLPTQELLHARWGQLPAGAAYDPSLAPSEKPSWFFDLDSFTQTRSDFDQALLAVTCKRLGQRAYKFFRWGVTDDFLRFHGGNV